ncbi:hypothetical protein [Streptococcus oricebi]|uniref:hypothetical protein n=1 Tax=Streptococcus oricebi TaxID=1547447 RepID=UPI001FDA1703|nr:hypothetical protein [Streptococcus oricebi]
MIKLITPRFFRQQKPIFQLAYTSTDKVKVKAKLAELQEQFPRDYWRIDKLSLASDLD